MKSKPINVALKIRIAKHKEKNSEISYTNLAELFNVSYDQARAAHKDYLKGKFTKGRGSSKANGEAIKKEMSPDEIFESQFHTALSDLEANKNIDALDRISALEKISKIKKTAQILKLEAHIKRADADVIASIIRRYAPEATDEDIIKIYREEIEKLKLHGSL